MQQYSLKLDANSGFHQTKPSYSLRLALHWGDTAIKDSYLVSIQVLGLFLTVPDSLTVNKQENHSRLKQKFVSTIAMLQSNLLSLILEMKSGHKTGKSQG